MTQVGFDHVVTLADSGDLFLTGITDMVVAQSSAGPVLYTMARPGGGDLLAYRIGNDGALALIASRSMPGATQPGATHRMSLHSDDQGDQFLLMTGANGVGLTRVDLTATGGINTPATVSAQAMPSLLLASASAEVGGHSYVYGVVPGSTTIGVWSIANDDTLTVVQPPDSGNNWSVGLTDIVTTTSGNTPILLAASAADHGLISYELSDQGHPVEVDRISAADGVGIGGASAVATVSLNGQAYAILAASGSSTLSVAEVGSDGSLTLTDHVMDTLNTRFAQAHTLSTTTHEGRGFVAAAGTDDGVTVFEILPGGHFRLMEVIADADDTTLDNVSALSLSVQGDALHLAVSSSSEAGLSVFTLDISDFQAPLRGTDGADTLTGGALDDVIAGGTGADHIYGEAGADVIMDGAGQDELWGGTGVDVFIMAGDRTRDTIHDFDVAVDQLDLSHWPMLRSTAQLEFVTRTDGITLRFGSEELVLLSADGQPIAPEEITALDLVATSRFLPDWSFVFNDEPENPDDPNSPVTLTGTVASDTLVGGLGGDTISGLNDDDDIAGMGGADTLRGDQGNDTINGNEGNDLVEGGDGHDTLSGGNGFDTIRGDEGDDDLTGLGGEDVLDGGLGQDTLSGNAGSDVINGGDGHDEISGGIGFDTINGQEGNDTIWGNDGFDVIGGGDGDDVISGNNGSDSLYGDNGNDTLSGGLADDFLGGGNGNDVLSGNAGPDVLRGNAGNDLLSGNAGSDLLEGGLNNDRLNGGLGHDTLMGGDGHDRLNGNNGFDWLEGESGNDTLAGNTGNDTLDGGTDDDLLLGGKGADTFIFSSGQDVIGDFQNEIDTLVLDRALVGGTDVTVQDLAQYATVTESGMVLDFENGNSLTLDGISSINVLTNDLDFF